MPWINKARPSCGLRALSSFKPLAETRRVNGEVCLSLRHSGTADKRGSGIQSRALSGLDSGFAVPAPWIDEEENSPPLPDPRGTG